MPGFLISKKLVHTVTTVLERFNTSHISRCENVILTNNVCWFILCSKPRIVTKLSFFQSCMSQFFRKSTNGRHYTGFMPSVHIRLSTIWIIRNTIPQGTGQKPPSPDNGLHHIELPQSYTRFILHEVVPPTPNAHSTNVTTTTHRRPLDHNRMGTFCTFIVLYGLNHISVYILVGLISMTRPERRSYILCDDKTHLWILQYWTDYVYLCMVVMWLSWVFS